MGYVTEHSCQEAVDTDTDLREQDSDSKRDEKLAGSGIETTQEVHCYHKDSQGREAENDVENRVGQRIGTRPGNAKLLVTNDDGSLRVADHDFGVRHERCEEQPAANGRWGHDAFHEGGHAIRT